MLRCARERLLDANLNRAREGYALWKSWQGCFSKMRISPRPSAHVAVAWGSWVKHNCLICFLNGVPRPIRGSHLNSQPVPAKTFQVLQPRPQAGRGVFAGLGRGWIDGIPSIFGGRAGHSSWLVRPGP